MTSGIGQRLRAVVDTNVLVSGVIVRHGNPNHLLRLWQQGRFSLITSSELVREVERVLQKPSIQRKYHVLEEDIAELIDSLQGVEQAVPPDLFPLRSRDPNDDVFLAVALGGAVDYLVTGDDDLLSLQGSPELGTLRIVTPHTFIDILGETQAGTPSQVSDDPTASG